MSRRTRSALATTLSTAMGDFVMMVDKGCEKMCVGSEWCAKARGTLSANGLVPRVMSETEGFEFGAGGLVKSACRREIPLGVGGVPLVLGISEVPTDVPLLGPRHVFEELDMQLDAHARRASFLRIGAHQCELALTASSHLAVRWDCFPAAGFPAEADRWELHGLEVFSADMSTKHGGEAAEVSEAFRRRTGA